MLQRKKIETDFCVVGGGMSGMCAAIAAARHGSKVVLMHERPVLGGNASSEIRMWISGSWGENNRETGILEEIMLENFYRNPTKNYYIWDSVLYDFVIREPNITLLLNCTCMDAATSSGEYPYGRDTHIDCVTGYQMTTQTFFDVHAKYYADCSGDSVLAPLTGAEYRIGREAKDEYGENTHVYEADNMTMGMSCLLQGRETTRPVSFKAPSWSTKLEERHFEGRNPDIYKTNENFWYLELGGDKDSIHDTEEVAKDLIPLAFGTWDYIKNSGNFKADNWELEFMGFLPGKRESRRLVGEYIINQKDISDNTLYEDTVAFGGWPLDDHYPAGFYHRGAPNSSIPTPAPYCIPYRALYSKNIDNLFFAGRNISMTHTAMSSIRVMATCCLLGQAVGTAVSIATRCSLSPHGVYVEKIQELQDILLCDDCFLPSKTREVSKLCKNTEIVNGDDTLKNGQDRPHRIYGNINCGISIDNNKSFTYEWKDYQDIESIHIVFDSDLSRNAVTDSTDSCERTRSTRANILLDSPEFYMPKTLCRDFKLDITTPDGTEELLTVTDNKKRAWHIPLNKKVSRISLTPINNWGDEKKTTVFSFDFR